MGGIRTQMRHSGKASWKKCLMSCVMKVTVVGKMGERACGQTHCVCGQRKSSAVRAEGEKGGKQGTGPVCHVGCFLLRALEGF